MKENEIDIRSLKLHKTFDYTPKFNNFFFYNFISKEEENVDSQFSFTVMNALLSLTDACRKQQGLSFDNIEGEFIRYNNYIIVNNKIIDFIDVNLNNNYYIDFFTSIIPEFIIVEQNISEDCIYVVENNNCVLINFN